MDVSQNECFISADQGQLNVVGIGRLAAGLCISNLRIGLPLITLFLVAF